MIHFQLIVCSNIWLLCLIVVFSPGGTASLWTQTFPFSGQSWPNLIWISLTQLLSTIRNQNSISSSLAFGCNAQNFNKQAAPRNMKTLKETEICEFRQIILFILYKYHCFLQSQLWKEISHWTFNTCLTVLTFMWHFWLKMGHKDKLLNRSASEEGTLCWSLGFKSYFSLSISGEAWHGNLTFTQISWEEEILQFEANSRSNLPRVGDIMFVKLQMWKKQIALFGENRIALEQHFKPFCWRWWQYRRLITKS